MENKKEESKIKILYKGGFCPENAQWSTSEHDFIHLKEDKLFFCQNCGLTISYGESDKK
ncbi:MAG: hypothetical protein Q8N87_01440 [bacterium]|nr:hypothetical protein [bacterium]